MQPRSSTLAIGAALLVVVSLALAGPVGGAGYELTVAESIATPPQTVDIEGETFPVEGVAAIEPGDPIVTTVRAPAGFRLYLYNEAGQSEYKEGWDHTGGTMHVTLGTADDALDTTTLEPGTYLLSLRDNERRSVHPVVIQGYEISLKAPSSIEPTEDIELTATVEPIVVDGEPVLSDSPDEVTVALWDGENAAEVTLEHTGAGEYEATLDAATLGAGTYELYGGVMESNPDGEYPTAIAVTDGPELTITEESSGSDEAPGSGGSTGGGDVDESEPTKPETNQTEEDTQLDDRSDDNESTDSGDELDNTNDTGDEVVEDDDGQPGEENTANESENGSTPDGENSTATPDRPDNESTVLKPNKTGSNDGQSETESDELGNPSGVLTLIGIILGLGAVQRRQTH
ncbi:hypothetical protein [Natronosalvus rutilus]|uniref:Uncharacterized protein n=1 Tax=Natronosalvus rutilus TaxID=2953753 RepID=A0A9E7SVS3_9EURY|nr:hypothetical protein [Natronosalvus rutilus]UTF54760.1 hypothetical protein NGM29_05685 [Natronosalvus rutilus]